MAIIINADQDAYHLLHYKGPHKQRIMSEKPPLDILISGSPPLEYINGCTEKKDLLPPRPFSADNAQKYALAASMSLLSVVTTETTITMDDKLQDTDSSKTKSPSPTGGAKMGRHKFEKSSKQRVILGTPIDEDHVSYVLMYDMLTGIRVAVVFIVI